MGARGGGTWSLANPGNRAARQELTRVLLEVAARDLGDDEAVLDCGCGGGWLLEALADAGVEPGRLHGVDLDAVRVETVRQRVPGTKILAADARSLPFPACSFAAVFFVVSLSSMGGAAAARAALSEGRRVLAPDGVLAVYEPRLPNPLNGTTRRLRSADLRAAGVTPVESRSLTLLPPLGRHLGRLTGTLHPALSRLPPLRSHRLTVYRELSAREPGTAPRRRG